MIDLVYEIKELLERYIENNYKNSGFVNLEVGRDFLNVEFYNGDRDEHGNALLTNFIDFIDDIGIKGNGDTLFTDKSEFIRAIEEYI